MTKGTHRLSNKNTEDNTADCLQCGPVQMRFRKDRNYNYCPNSSSAKGWVQLRGVTIPSTTLKAAKQAFLQEQDGLCAICGKADKDDDRAFSLDHCHDSGKLRGVLCRTCNLGLGHFKDDVSLLERAITYLHR